ncbi:unnamed protein product, partial [Nesidiocoris tenuis]
MVGIFYFRWMHPVTRLPNHLVWLGQQCDTPWEIFDLPIFLHQTPPDRLIHIHALRIRRPRNSSQIYRIWRLSSYTIHHWAAPMI